MKNLLRSIGAGAAALAVLVLAPASAQAGGGTDCSMCHANPPMPYVGHDKVAAALDAIPPMQALAPRPATIPGGGGNVRNLGPGYINVNGQLVMAGDTSYQVGITDAYVVRGINRDGQRDLRMWRMESVNGRMVWVDKGCRLGSADAAAVWSIGNGDFAAKATGCGLG